MDRACMHAAAAGCAHHVRSLSYICVVPVVSEAAIDHDGSSRAKVLDAAHARTETSAQNGGVPRTRVLGDAACVRAPPSDPSGTTTTCICMARELSSPAATVLFWHPRLPNLLARSCWLVPARLPGQSKFQTDLSPWGREKRYTMGKRVDVDSDKTRRNQRG
jgi:hypothetical protein